MRAQTDFQKLYGKSLYHSVLAAGQALEHHSCTTNARYLVRVVVLVTYMSAVRESLAYVACCASGGNLT